MANFKGFKQETLTNYNALTKEDKLNYLWLVRDVDKSGKTEIVKSSAIYFGSRKYAEVNGSDEELVKKINAITSALGMVAGQDGAFETYLPIGGDSILSGETITNVSEALKALSKAIVAAEATADTASKNVAALTEKVGTEAAGDNPATGIYAKIDAVEKKLDPNQEGSLAKDVENAKTSLVGTATEGYQTLGELETKIKEEAVRAKAAESKNEAAAATADAKAVAAQQTADAKVASVGVEGAIVKSGTDTAPTIGLKLAETQGNVVLSQENGLKAEIDLRAFGVKGVAEGEKVISVSNGLLSSTLSLKYDSVAKKINLYGKAEDETNLISSIDATDFIKDGMLEKAELKVVETEIDATHPAGTYIVLTWNTAAGKEAMPINVTSLIDTYTAKADGGLVLEDHAFSVDYEKVAKKGDLDAVEGRVTTLEGKVGSAKVGETPATGLFKDVADNKAAIEAETTRAQGAEKANADAITILNGNSGVTGSVDQKIQAALEAGAVTLEVKNDDKYLGVTSATTEGKGTVYTLASKADKINEAIKAEADKVKVSVTNGTYVKGSVDKAGRAITLSETVQKVATSSESAKGLAEASDVKAYVDGKVSGKNVAAEGDTLVSASASGNTVTVAATQKLKDAVANAESSVQSVNGKTGSTVTLTGADIATNHNLSGSENATVNAVLADIYAKLRVVVKADGKTIKEADDHTLSVNLEAKTDTTVANGHVALTHGDDGALYGVMYYSGDDIDA